MQNKEFSWPILNLFSSVSASTRKLYEKKLLKLKEQGQELRSLIPTPIASSSAENSKQNGSNDSDQYSDNEEGKIKT